MLYHFVQIFSHFKYCYSDLPKLHLQLLTKPKRRGCLKSSKLGPNPPAGGGSRNPLRVRKSQPAGGGLGAFKAKEPFGTAPIGSDSLCCHRNNLHDKT